MAVTKINVKQIDAFSGSTASEVEVQRDMNLQGNVLDGVGQLTASNALITSDMVIQGNLTVDGAQLIANVTVLEVEDLAIRAAKNATASAAGDGAGLQVMSGAAEQSILWSHANQRVDVSAPVSASFIHGTLNGDAGQLERLDTDDLAEGSSNLYWTVARGEAMFDSKLAAADTGDLAEGSSLYFTDARARAAVSVTDAGGDGSLAYDSGTGVITYTGPSAAEVRAHFSAGEMVTIASGEVAIHAPTFSASADVRWDAKFAAADTDGLSEGSSNLYWTVARGEAMFDSKLAAADTGDLSEGSNLYYTDERVDDRVGALVVGGDAVSSVYDDAAGTLTLAAQVDDSSIEIASDALQVKALGVTNAMLAGGIASSKLAELNNFDTDDLAEGSSNAYFTQARARGSISVTDAGGDGSLAYDSGTGVITYTGPSAAEVRAHLSVNDTNSIDLSYSGGAFEADLLLSGSGLEVTADGLRIAAAGVGGGLTWADGVISMAAAAGEDIDVAADSFRFVDASDSNITKTESIADLMTAAAGDGIVASSGVLAIDFAEEQFTSANFTGLASDNLADTPAPADSIQVFLNGMLLAQGAGKDYQMSGDSVVLEDADMSLDADDIMIVRYTK